MIKRQFLAALLAASALAVNPAFAWRGGGFGGFHAGGFHAGGFGAGGFHGGAWHAGGVHAYGGTWHADGYHGGGVWGGGYGFHGPVVVNSYYHGGCFACARVGLGLAAAATTYAIGASLATLPGSCNYRIVGGNAYYVCGSTWLQPEFGNNGVHYLVVSPL